MSEESLCLSPNAPMNFECVKKIINSLRSGSFNVMTLRMILLQVDRGLAMMAPTSSVSELDSVQLQSALTFEQKLGRIEELLFAPEFPTTQGIKEEMIRLMLDYLIDLLKDLLTKSFN